MSLHVLTENGEWHEQPLADDAETAERAYEVRAICDCGWVGLWHGSDVHTAHARSRIDYREHVEDALGPAAYYDASVACRNCGIEQEQPVLVGTHVTSNACARCGTRMLSPNNDAWNEQRERSSRWSW